MYINERLDKLSVYFICDINGSIVKANTIFKQVFNVNQVSEICSLRDVFSEELSSIMLEYHEIVLKTRKPSYVRHKISINGINRDFLFRRAPLIENRKLIGVSTLIFLDDNDLCHEYLDSDSYSYTSGSIDENFDFMVVTDRNGFFQYVSSGTSELLGYSLSEMIGHKRVDFMENDDAESMMARFTPFYENHLPFFGLHNTVKTKDGKRYTFVSNGTPLFTSNGDFLGYQVVNHNLTPILGLDSKSEINTNSMEQIIRSVKDNFTRINSSIKKMSKIQNVVSMIARSFLRANIESLSDKIDDSLELIGKTTKVDRVYIFSHDDENSRISNIYEWCNDGIEPEIDMLQNLDTAIFAWSINIMRKDQLLNIYDVNSMTEEQSAEQEILKMQGILSILIVPLISDGQLIGFLGFDSVKMHKHWTDELDMITVLAEIYTSALVRMKNDKELLNSVLRTNKLLEQTIESFASIVEINDPYTSGHQNRTAELAVGIAHKLGMGEESKKTLYYSSLLHDLGKFYIPSQILNKPGKLSEIEFSMIKTHPNLGYQVLKKIDFPWPVADIVIQHHERIDGSGYPYGLVGNEILFEARILAVADVVESMSSHRPYRPSLGIHAALDEISKNKGVIYDSKVVTACLELFEKDGFRFSES
jgi:PAS domain S-box-containing protein